MQSDQAIGGSTPPASPGFLARRLQDADLAGFALKALRIGLFYAALLGLWQLVYELEIWKPYSLPSPEAVWLQLRRYVDNGILADAIQLTMKRMFIGYTLSLVVGFTVGMMSGANKYIDETLGSLVLGLQSLPSITWLPLAILWFGLNDNAIIFVVFMGSVCSVAIAARAGVKSLPPLYRRAAHTMGANSYQSLRYVLIPAMVPAMAQGLKQGWSFAWRSLMAGEILILGKPSLGGLLETGRGLNNMRLVIAVMLVIVAIGLLVDRLVFSRLDSWVQERWGLQST